MSDQAMIPIPIPSQLPPTVTQLSDTAPAVSDTPTGPDRLSVRLDRDSSQNLLTIMGATGNQTDAVKYALMIAADVCRGSWTLGYTPLRTLPDVSAFRVQTPAGGYGDYGVRG